MKQNDGYNKYIFDTRFGHLKKAIAGSIKQALHDLDIDRVEMARRCGISQSYVTRILKCECNLKLDTIVKIETGLGIQLLDVKENEPFSLGF